MDPQLQRALDALQKAHDAGNVEDARQIAEYIKLYQTELENKAMLESGEESMLKNPVVAGTIGAVAGPVAGRALETAYGPKGIPSAATSTAAPTMTGTAGQRYAAKTGYGAGSGETVREVVEEFKKQEGPLGKGKVTSKIKGGPLGGAAAMEQIAAKEADAARFAQMRAANEIAAQQAAQKAGSPVNRIAQATSGKMPLLLKSLAGASAGVQGADAYNRFQEGDYLGAGLGAIGAAGSAASLIPHPITRIGGTALGLGAGALNTYIDYLKSKAQPMKEGGLVYFAKGGSTTPAWQRSEGKNPEGGLNAKGRASYNRETGGNLKAPQPEGGSRKKSFCARMGGMKKKLTSSKTANDPDSRINKALRKWKC